MGKPLLGFVLLILVLCAVVADLHKRSRSGIPDPKTTGIATQTLSSRLRIGGASQEISPFLVPDSKSQLPAAEIEKNANPWIWIAERPLSDGALPPMRKPLQGRFYVKAILLADPGNSIAILSFDLPLLRKEHLNALYDRLRQDHGLLPSQILSFAVGFQADITVPPESLAQNASLCLRNARQALKSAEIALIEAVEPSLPVNDGRVPVAGAGSIDLAPLCGPVAGGKQYDAGTAVSRFFGILVPDSVKPAPGALLTRPLPPAPFRMLLFRSRENGRLLGALVLAPIPPIVLPAAAFNRISPDYAFPLAKELEKKLECPCLFIRTPSADRIPVVEEASFSNAQRFGSRVAAVLLAQVKKARFTETGRVRAYSLAVRLPLKPWAAKSEPELSALSDRYRRELQDVRSTSLDLPFKRELLDRSLTALYLGRHRALHGFEEAPLIKAVSMGQGPLLLALPGNGESSIETRIKGTPHPFPLLIASDLDGYISPVVPEERSDGGFRPNLSVYTHDAENRIVHRSLELIRAIRPGHPR